MASVLASSAVDRGFEPHGATLLHYYASYIALVV